MFFAGSPPQVRGKQNLLTATYSENRITPAGAGKTYICKLIGRAGKDHPRRCGENALKVEVFCSVGGSPPQVRGKPRWSSGVDAARRITPAGAGKTDLFIYMCRDSEDHPRRCGENEWADLNNKVGIGSPPQVRGKPAVGRRRGFRSGITPAGAGKTTVLQFRQQTFRDHPRRCGENAFFVKSCILLRGSPPQVRGKRSRRAAT